MAITNHERIDKGLELLRKGLGPFVEREFADVFKSRVKEAAIKYLGEDRFLEKKNIANWDAAALLRLVWDSWNDVFRKTLGQAERTMVRELQEVRNKWAHQQTFTSDDAYRALDSVTRMLTAISAPEAQESEGMKMELLRLRFDEQVRNEKRKSADTAIASTVAAGLKPWREVITPHKDVASGKYQKAEFAADLWQVHIGEGSDEYQKPDEFFRRTYLTENLKHLLVEGVRRLTGKGGDPVIQLQTNFGGGKTHSMLALYHLFSGASPNELSGVDTVLAEAGVKELPKAKRVVIVGNKISPATPSVKKDGTIVRTFWGELAWQLGGKKAYAHVAADDEKATSPGDVLRELFNEYAPCLILIDEWVAYARMLHDQSDLPAGGFETQFTFAQALTESVKLAKNCMLVISLPASDTSGSPHTQAEDVEVGGVRGREALDRLRNVVGRLESSWRPASTEEGFEIVRRRLFEPFASPEQFKQRDIVARQFFEFYRAQSQEFPPECHDSDYEKRIKAAYPIHPEVFDRLYTDWSTLIKFQRTRGVLRLMAAVIHSLWEKGDKNPLILPSLIPIDDPRVQPELTRYLSDNWTPIIEKDVDGPNSIPLRIDSDVPNLGKIHACRRVARTIYMGSAPTLTAAHRGLEDRRIKLGCVLPGESPSVFGDALRRLAGSCTYLYQDGSRFWYSTQPTVTKLAADRAEQFKRDTDKVIQEIEKRVRTDLRTTGDFPRIHAFPSSGVDVPDDYTANLIVLRTETPYDKDDDCPAVMSAKAIMEMRGNTPRLYRNTLVFLAADKMRLQDLDEAVRHFLAWESIIEEKEKLNLDPHQLKQAVMQKTAAESSVSARIPETYQWLLIPTQNDPKSEIKWQAIRLTGTELLAVRASRKLKNDEHLVSTFAPSRLRMDLDRIPLWRGNHVALKQLVEDYARYLYLSRLREPAILMNAIRSGLSLLNWESDSFAYADEYDELGGRYRGLQAGQNVSIPDEDAPGLLVKPDVAQEQLNTEKKPIVDEKGKDTKNGSGAQNDNRSIKAGKNGTQTDSNDQGVSTKPHRYHGSVILDPARVGRDAGRVAEEVISHLTGIVSAKVKVTLEIEAEIPQGASEQVVRTVTENSRTLKFDSHGFEKE